MQLLHFSGSVFLVFFPKFLWEVLCCIRNVAVVLDGMYNFWEGALLETVFVCYCGAIKGCITKQNYTVTMFRTENVFFLHYF